SGSVRGWGSCATPRGDAARHHVRPRPSVAVGPPPRSSANPRRAHLGRTRSMPQHRRQTQDNDTRTRRTPYGRGAEPDERMPPFLTSCFILFERHSRRATLLFRCYCLPRETAMRILLVGFEPDLGLWPTSRLQWKGFHMECSNE